MAFTVHPLLYERADNQVKQSAKPPRSSNLELYRIICMLMIVAHHYVVSSGLTLPDGPLFTNGFSLKSGFLWLFGMFGKTGINCFMMITGYFMCQSIITIRKFLKLFLEIYFYKILIYIVFLITGYESFSALRAVKLIMPFWEFKNDFVSCFIVFYMTIPFWSILVHNMTRRQHQLLLILLLSCYTLCGSIPTFGLSYNYITWFGIIFLMASYFRMYPAPIFEKKSLWGWLTLLSILVAVASVLFLWRFNALYWFMSDCHKFFAVVIAVCSFLWFKNLKINFSKIINAFGAATFGVLLIHANSPAMRTWLWKDFVDCVGHYSLPLGQLVLFSVGVVIAVFVVCNLIDQLRIATLEMWFFRWYDEKLSDKADRFFLRLTNS